MLERILNEGLKLAGISDEEFMKAIKKAGYKTRLAWLLSEDAEGVLAAYNERVQRERASA